MDLALNNLQRLSAIKLKKNWLNLKLLLALFTLFREQISAK